MPTAPRPCSNRWISSSPPATASDSSEPTGPARPRCCGCWPAWTSADAGTVRLAPPDATVGYLPQEPERRPGESLRAYLRPPHRRRRGRGRAGVAVGGAGVGWRPTTPTAVPSTATSSLGGPDLDARIGVVLARPRPARRPRSTWRWRPCRVARRPGRRWPSLLLSRFDVFLLDEPTNDLDFAGLDRARAILGRGRWGPAWWSCPTTGPSSSGRSPSVLELDERDPPGRRSTTAGGSPTWRPGRSPAATPRRRTPSTGTSAGPSRTAPGRSASGRSRAPAREEEAPKDNDKAQRGLRRQPHREAGGQGAHHREGPRPARRRRQAVGGVGAPVLDRRRRAQRRRGRPPAGAVVRAGLVPARAARPRDRVGRAGRHPRAATAPARRRCSAPSSADVPLAAGERWLGPGVVVGELDQRRAPLRRRASRCSTRSRAASRACRCQEARSLLAKFGLDRRARRPAGGRRCRPASGPGPCSPCSWPGASTAWCSTSPPTTSTCPPSSSSSRPSRLRRHAAARHPRPAPARRRRARPAPSSSQEVRFDRRNLLAGEPLPFATARSTSAWHGAPGRHQQARSRPASSRRTSATSKSSSPLRRASPYRATHVAPSPSRPATNGFPHLDGRATTTAPAGFRHPFVLRSCTRSGTQPACPAVGRRQGAARVGSVISATPRWMYCSSSAIRTWASRPSSPTGKELWTSVTSRSPS